MAEHILVSCEQPLLMSDRQSDDSTIGTVVSERFSHTNVFTHLPMVGDVWLDCGDEAVACCASFSTFRGESLNDSFRLCDFDLLARCFEKLPSRYL